MSSADDDLESEIDRLYQGPLSTFTSRRNHLVKRLRTAGHRLAADRVKALEKPSLTAWVVNQLWWNHRDTFEALFNVGRELRTADPATQQEALTRRRHTMDQLLRLARDVLNTDKKSMTLARTRQISTTLDACCAYGHQPSDAVVGRFAKDLDPPGFDALTSASNVSPSTRKAPSDDSKPDEHQARLERATLVVHEAQQALESASRAAEAASRHATLQQQRYEHAKREVEDAMARAQAAERNHLSAQSALSSRNLELEQQQTSVELATAELAELQAKLHRSHRTPQT